MLVSGCPQSLSTRKFPVQPLTSSASRASWLWVEAREGPWIMGETCYPSTIFCGSEASHRSPHIKDREFQQDMNTPGGGDPGATLVCPAGGPIPKWVHAQPNTLIPNNSNTVMWSTVFYFILFYLLNARHWKHSEEKKISVLMKLRWHWSTLNPRTAVTAVRQALPSSQCQQHTSPWFWCLILCVHVAGPRCEVKPHSRYPCRDVFGWDEHLNPCTLSKAGDPC